MRWLIKTFVLALILCIAIDAMPWEVLPSDQPKRVIGSMMNRAAIWQGTWSMFTPTPSVNNLWVSADLESEQATEYWSSPYWEDESDWAKFTEFRSMNYFNRLNLRHNRFATQDFAEYLLREHDSPSKPLRRVVVFGNGYNMIAPEQGEVMPAEDIVFSVNSQTFAIAEAETEENAEADTVADELGTDAEDGNEP